MGAKRPKNVLYYRGSLYGFQCWNLKSRCPGFFFQNRDFFLQYLDLKSRHPGFFSSAGIFVYCGVWSLFGDLFFFNYFFGKKFIKTNCHQKVTKLCRKKNFEIPVLEIFTYGSPPIRTPVRVFEYRTGSP